MKMVQIISAVLCSFVMVLTSCADEKLELKVMKESYRKIVLAGGCFWCMQPPYDNTEGVVETTVGYIGGHVDNPTYEAVCSGRTGHTEAIEIVFDPEKVTLDKLLYTFWRNIDPTTKNGQFADMGTQYRTGIFYYDDEQKSVAEKSKNDLAASGKFDKPVVTEITQATRFWPAKEYHQKYYEKNVLRYNSYKIGSGRAGYIKKTWGGESK